MADSIKRQALARLMDNLQPLVSAGTVRALSRGLDPQRYGKLMPAIYVFDGPEQLLGRDSRGVEITFGVSIQIMCSGNDAAAVIDQKDAIVPEVQRIVEADLQMGGLIVSIEAGTEIPFVSENTTPEGGAVLEYTIQYRRLWGNPYGSY